MYIHRLMAASLPIDVTSIRSNDNNGSELQFEHDHVSSVYKSIAEHFSYTRFKAWPKIEELLQSQPDYSIIADIGCGNGKDSYAGNNSTNYMFGCDICYELLTIAKSRGVQVFQADTANIPIRAGVCDVVISIAVLHHLCSERRRLMAIRELTRILKPGGKLLIYVWAFEQKGKQFPSQDVLVPWHRRKIIDDKIVANQKIQTTKKVKSKTKKDRKIEKKGKSSHLSITEDEGEGCLNLECLFLEQELPSVENDKDNLFLDTCENKEVILDNKTIIETEITENVINTPKNIHIQNEHYMVYMRYYHLFCQNELKHLIENNIRDLSIVDNYYDHDNWCILAIKL